MSYDTGAQPPQNQPQYQQPQPQYQQQPPQYEQPQAGWTTPQPAAPRANPFAGVPLSDYGRDAAALILLLVSLALPWDYASGATAHVDVVLITVLSVVSLSLTYLARTGVLPARFTLAQLWTVRILANTPYVVLVLVYAIIDAVRGGDFFLGSGGVGYAAAFGLAGAVFAAQPRAAELRGGAEDARIATAWFRITVGFGIVSMALSLLNVVLVLSGEFIRFLGAIAVVGILVTLLINAAAIVLLYVGVFRRSEVVRLIGAVVGISVLGAILVDLITGGAVGLARVESLHAIGYGALLLSAVAGVFLAPPLRLAMKPIDPLGRWFRTVEGLYLVVAGLAASCVLITVLVLASGAGAAVVGFAITLLIVFIAMGIVALIARTTLRTSAATSRGLLLGLTGGLLVLGIVHIAVAATGVVVAVIDLVLAFGLPLAIGVLLTVPKPVRDFWASVAPARAPNQPQAAPAFATGAVPVYTSAPAAPTAPTPAAPAVAVPPVAAAQATPPATLPSTPPPPAPPAPPVTPSGFTAQQAADPATDAATLYRIAQEEPSLRPHLAANPSTYPDLLQWLGSLGDPAVDAALRSRYL